MLTFTAPGDRVHFHRGSVCGCWAGPVDLASWNATLGGQDGRWNRLLRDLRRTYGDLQYFRAVEVQKRGALHLHVLVRRRSGAPLVMSLARVRQLAIKHGFGHEVDVSPVLDGRAASYVSKYVSKASDERCAVPWRDSAGARRFTAPYRTWSASRAWGVTMRTLLACAAIYARSDGWETLDPVTGEYVNRADALPVLQL